MYVGSRLFRVFLAIPAACVVFGVLQRAVSVLDLDSEST
jgi:hypothetical protein